MNKNSIITYYEFVKPNLTQRELDVFNGIIIFKGITIYELSAKMNKFPNQISGRFSGLQKKGVIIGDGFKEINGTKHTIWKINF